MPVMVKNISVIHRGISIIIWVIVFLFNGEIHPLYPIVPAEDVRINLVINFVIWGDIMYKTEKVLDLKKELENSFKNLLNSFKVDKGDNGICLSDVEFMLYEHKGIISKLEEYIK
jgi:hypothetical protein